MWLIDADQLIKTINKQATVDKVEDDAVGRFAGYLMLRFGYIKMVAPTNKYSMDEILDLISEYHSQYDTKGWIDL